MPSSNQDNKKVNTVLEQAIRAVLTDRPVAYHPKLAAAVGGANAGIFISQLLYWTPRAHDPDGWIYKTRDEIREETALTRYEQETARKLLRKVRVLEEKRQGVGNLLYFRVNMEALVSVLGQSPDRPPDEEDNPTKPQINRKVENPPTGRLETNLPEGGKPAGWSAGNQPPLYVTENTTETTTESNVVVEQLKKFGISETTANRFANNYPEEHITDKLALAQWLVAQSSPLVRKNPAGWLKTAIEEDFDPPKDYEMPSARKARTANQAKVAAAAAEKRKQAEEEYRRTQEEIQQRIRDNHPPEPVGKDGLTTESAWALTLEKMEAQISPAMFQTWLKNTMLVSLEGKNANIVVPNQNTADWIDRRLYQSLNRTFRDIIGREVDFRFVPAEVPPLTAA